MDAVLAKMEALMMRLETVENSATRTRIAEVDILVQVEAARDLLQDALKGDKVQLGTMYGGKCVRIGKLRWMLETVHISGMYIDDQRWSHIASCVVSVEAVLKELGTYKKWVPPAHMLNSNSSRQGNIIVRGVTLSAARPLNPSREENGHSFECNNYDEDEKEDDLNPADMRGAARNRVVNDDAHDDAGAEFVRDGSSVSENSKHTSSSCGSSFVPQCVSLQHSTCTQKEINKKEEPTGKVADASLRQEIATSSFLDGGSEKQQPHPVGRRSVPNLKNKKPSSSCRKMGARKRRDDFLPVVYEDDRPQFIVTEFFIHGEDGMPLISPTVNKFIDMEVFSP